MLGVHTGQSQLTPTTTLCRATLSHLDASPAPPIETLLTGYAVMSQDAESTIPQSTSARRKSVPSRSIPKGDENPGLVFRVDGGVQVVCVPNESPRLLLAASPSRDWGWRISEGNLQSKRGSEKVRPRSNSMTQAERLASLHEERQRQNDSESEETGSDCNLTHPAAISIPKRRASVSAGHFNPAASPNAGNHITVYSASLAHLVPNTFLQTTSRRISTHGVASGCMCTSCSSTVTPYWRDGWADDVMLCNACGLRFQKFARRCPSCLYIPRKEDSLGNNCIKCSAPWIVGPVSNFPQHCSYTSFSQ